MDNVIYINCMKNDCYWNITELHPNNKVLNKGICACRKVTIDNESSTCSMYTRDKMTKIRLDRRNEENTVKKKDAVKS